MKQVPPTGGAASWAAMALTAAAMWNSTMPWSAARRSGQSLAWGAAATSSATPAARRNAPRPSDHRAAAAHPRRVLPLHPHPFSRRPCPTAPPGLRVRRHRPGPQRRRSPPGRRRDGRRGRARPCRCAWPDGSGSQLRCWHPPAVASAMVALSDLTLRPVVPVSRCHQGLDWRALPRALQAPGSRRPVGPFRGSPRELVERGRTPRRPFSLRGGQPGCWSGCASPESTPHGTRATGPA